VSPANTLTDWQRLEDLATAAFGRVGKSMTEQRRAVLLAMWSTKSVMTLETMSASLNVYHTASRSSVARALVDFTDAGIFRRIETRSGYILAPTRTAILLVCRSCPSVVIVEMTALDTEFATLASSYEFRVKLAAVEIVGTCADCTRQISIG
jgi:Fe2+ or Zn2+ uptake regulation protein